MTNCNLVVCALHKAILLFLSLCFFYVTLFQDETFRSLYKPSVLAVDTFYSKFDSIRVKGLPLEISKDGWIATASSFDDRSGASYRPPSNTIDNNPSTIWVNKISTDVTYPHWVQVDMGVIHPNIEGFAIITRVGDAAARPKTVELLISEDGIEWQTFGDFFLENTGDKQFIPLPESVNARFFKIIAKEPHRADRNVALAEIGVFTR